MRAGAEGCEFAFHAAAHLGEWGTREEFERDNVGGTRNALEACRARGRAALRPRRHRGGAAGRPAARERERGRAAAPRLEGALPGDQGDGRAGGARRERRRLRDRRRAAAARLGPRRHDDRSRRSSSGDRAQAASPGSAAAATSPSTTHVDNTVEGLVLGATRGHAGRRLLRHRRRAGRLPRLHHASCSRPRASSRRDRNMPAPVARVVAGAGEASGGRFA